MFVQTMNASDTCVILLATADTSVCQWNSVEGGNYDVRCNRYTCLIEVKET